MSETMTPALKAMVEAMAAELRRQHEEDDGTLSFPMVGELREGRFMGHDGVLDLEGLARAGLEAIKPAHPLDVDDITAKGSLAEYALRDAIDAILKGQR